MKLTYELFESLKVYHDILENCDVGVNVADTQGILVYANQTSADYCNSTREEMIGRSIEEFYPRTFRSKGDPSSAFRNPPCQRVLCCR